MADDFLNALARFHREVFLPDFERVLDSQLGTRTGSIRDMMNSNFDKACRRFDRLEIGFQFLHDRIRRIDERLAQLETDLCTPT